MKKYNLSEIMKRAWEIKAEYDEREKNILLNHNIFRELEESEKALFSECLKMAWKEAKRANEIEEEYKIKHVNAARMAKKETRMVMAKECGRITWKVWRNYGKCRAYYTVSNWSRYQNNKGHYIELVA